jgi:PKD domain
MTVWSRRVLVVGFACVFAIALAGVGVGPAMVAPALAAPTWLAQTQLDGCSEYCGPPAVAVDAAGDETVATLDNAQGLIVATHPAGGAWSTPVAVANYIPGLTDSLASDPAGDTILAYTAGFDEIDAAIDPAGAAWSPTTPSVVVGHGSSTPSVAMDAVGDAVMTWADGGGACQNPNATETVYTAYRPAGGSWQTPVEVDPEATSCVAPEVAMTRSGTATLVWATANGPDDQAVVSATANKATDDGSWAWAPQLDTATYVYAVRIAVDAGGEATAAWFGYDTGDGHYRLAAAALLADGQWSPATNLVDGTAPIGAADQFDVAIDDAGTAAVAWTGTTGGVDVSELPPGGTWSSTPATLGTGSVYYPQVVIDSSGTATAVWGTNDTADGTAHLWSARQPANGVWGTPLAISAPEFEDFGDAATVDAAGDVDTVATLWNKSTTPLWAISEDVAGPRLAGLSIPATGTVGVPVDFAVSPIDAWSAIQTTSWDFGDGGSAIDDVVSHTYAAPGTYTVRVQSSDILGNPTITSAPIVITAAPVSPGGGSTPVTRAATPLTLTRVTQRHPRWREPGGVHTVTRALRRVPVSTRFGFAVNQAATVTLIFAQREPGRRVHASCRPVSLHDRREAHCLRWITRGTLTVHMTHAGSHSLSFAGRLGRRRLSAGNYAVTVRATATGAGAGTPSHRLLFSITG